ncbi:MAG: hypothetical protein P8R54_05500 [Myxococcota bacterium]|nr:hypothetical protein [Myxococcota bacterium]
MMLTTLLTMLSAQAAPALSVVLATEKPIPGDALSIEVRWTNDTAEEIRIPASWADELQMWVWRVAPGERPEPMRITRDMPTSITMARKMEWVAVPAGEAVSKQLPIEIEACAEGCQGGSYYGQVNLTWGIVDGMKPIQQLPQGQVPFSFDLTLPTESVTAAAGVTAAITSVSPINETGGIDLTVSLSNGTEAPLWVAGPEQWLGACLVVHKKGELTGLADNPTPPAALVEADSLLMQPGGAMEVAVSCPAIAPEKVKKPTIMVSIKPAAAFFAIENHEERRVFTGEIGTEAAAVPKK